MMCAKGQRTCQDFSAFSQAFFGNFRGIFVSFHNNSKLFCEKSSRWLTIKGFCARHKGVNILCAHKCMPFVRRGDKKKGGAGSTPSIQQPNLTRRVHTIAAPSTRCCMASCRMCRALLSLLQMRQCHSALICRVGTKPRHMTSQGNDAASVSC